ncbi:hypothetical protein AB6A40_005826 [Gnathostoma spinigerum]|uniref:Uncharacterized protein n=1 Tax=Gnathostoma spinigerum TaxID=75299 RepID=A0ABD6ERD2_9BILA
MVCRYVVVRNGGHGLQYSHIPLRLRITRRAISRSTTPHVGTMRLPLVVVLIIQLTTTIGEPSNYHSFANTVFDLDTNLQFEEQTAGQDSVEQTEGQREKNPEFLENRKNQGNPESIGDLGELDMGNQETTELNSHKDSDDGIQKSASLQTIDDRGSSNVIGVLPSRVVDFKATDERTYNDEESSDAEVLMRPSRPIASKSSQNPPRICAYLIPWIFCLYVLNEI